MRIALLGGNGQVGHELRRSLAPLGILAVGLREVPAHAGADTLAVDLAQGGQLKRLRAWKPQIIVNAAAYTAVDRAESEPELAQQVNHHAVAELAALAADSGALLVHYSTDYVFAGDASAPYHETDATAPAGVYGHSKLAGEQAIADSGCDALVLRTAWVYGARGHNFLRTMLRVAGQRDELRVVDDQQGTPTSSRLIADVTAQVLGQWIRSSSSQRRALCGLFHLTASGKTSWHGFATALLQGAVARKLIARMPEVTAIPSSEYPTPARRPAWSVLDCDRLCSNFGVHLPPWQQAMNNVLDELAPAV